MEEQELWSPETNVEQPVENIFRNKNFVLTFFGALVSNVGAILYSFAVSFYILTITNNNAVISGWYLFACGIAYVLFALVGGVVSDRFHKAKIMYICDYVKGALIVGTAVLFLLVKDPVTQLVFLFVTGILEQVIAAIFSPASSSLLPLIVKENQLQQANSYNAMLQSFQAIGGVLLAGVLYAFMPFWLLVLVVGLCYVASAISEMFIRYEMVKREEKLTLKVALKDVGDGFAYLRTKKSILWLTVAVLFINFFFNPMFNNFVPYFIKTDFPKDGYLLSDILTPEMWSSVGSVVEAIGSIVGALILSVQKPQSKIAKRLRVSFIALFLTVFAFSFSYFLLVDRSDNLNAYLITSLFIMAGIGMTVSFVNIPVGTSIQTQCDKTMLGKVNSFLNIGSMGLTPFGAFLAGYVIDFWGPSVLLFICSGGFLLTLLLILFNKAIGEL